MSTSSTATVTSSVPSTEDKPIKGSKIIAADEGSSGGGGSILGTIIGILILVLVIVAVWFAFTRGPVWVTSGPRPYGYGYGYGPAIIGGPVVEIGGRPGWGGGSHWEGNGHRR